MFHPVDGFSRSLGCMADEHHVDPRFEGGFRAGNRAVKLPDSGHFHAIRNNQTGESHLVAQYIG
ncbi:hypothetical protein SDC9_203253 [bioreactor metagenome]|uniref:Uncharacterized protein n=1 Tax=bioreactor metagenome TaxID=1076179 RepID=A0A645IYN9_9ZZZZ